MATWEDGPEYAPVARPAEFAEPPVGPLSVAPPVLQQAALAPKDRPTFDEPPVAVAPLAAVLPVVTDARDPEQPFAVVSSTVTSDSAWGALHGSTPAPGVERSGSWGPPAPTAWPAPQQPLVIHDSANTHGGFPSPGTPQWFGPGATYGQQPDRQPASAAAVLTAATPGLCICLLLGGLVWVIAPIMLAVTLGLSSRVRAAKAEVRRAFAIGIGTFVVIAMMAAVFNIDGFSAWWRTTGVTALVVCWGLLITTLVLVRRGLTAAPPAPRRASWG